MKNRLTILLAKFLSAFLHLFGRHAGTVPGRLALKFNPAIRDYLKLPGQLIVITGTNGKTTTTNLLAEVLRRSGKTVVANDHGNNIDWGITTTLLSHARLSGVVPADFVILETDEHWAPVLFSARNLQPTTLIVLDFFRDQLDRAGEVETIVRKLEKFVRHRDFDLILNGDDPNVVRLGLAHTKGRNLYYGLAQLPTSYQTSSDKMEGIICPRCKLPLTYDYYQYSHLGHFHCANCDFANAPLATQVTKIAGSDFTVALAQPTASESSTSSPTSTSSSTSRSVASSSQSSPSTAVRHLTFTTLNSNLYHIYNLLAIVTFLDLYHLDFAPARVVFATYDPHNGRCQTFDLGEQKVTLNLCKNPTGFNVVLRGIRHNSERKNLLLVLNDHVNDGFDVSWIWDIDFSDLSEFDRIVCAGTRAFDMAIPVKCSGFDPRRIIVEHDLNAAVRALLQDSRPSYVISNYSALTQVQKILTNLEHSHSTPQSTSSATARSRRSASARSVSKSTTSEHAHGR